MTTTISDLAARTCVPCEGTSPISHQEAEQLLHNLPGWILKDGLIEKEFRFKTYLAGLNFAYSIGEIAEGQGHHPSILIGWRRVRLSLSTHVIKGLSLNDFIMAAKAEVQYRKQNPS